MKGRHVARAALALVTVAVLSSTPETRAAGRARVRKFEWLALLLPFVLIAWAVLG